MRVINVISAFLLLIYEFLFPLCFNWLQFLFLFTIILLRASHSFLTILHSALPPFLLFILMFLMYDLLFFLHLTWLSKLACWPRLHASFFKLEFLPLKQKFIPQLFFNFLYIINIFLLYFYAFHSTHFLNYLHILNGLIIFNRIITCEALISQKFLKNIMTISFQDL